MKKIAVFMFIDAMGWEIVKDREFLKDLLPHRYRVGMQFGYSSTAIPTILSGEKPTVHKHLSFYYYAPEKSPFKMFRYMGLGMLPSSIADRWRVRHILSKLVAKYYGFTGYFEMYAMPFSRISYFDYIEKTDLFVPGGLSPVRNIADVLEDKRIPYHISNWRLKEIENIEALIQDVRKGDINFAFLYTAAMDGLLHRVTKDGSEINTKMDWYESQIRRLLAKLEKQYQEIYFAVFSDHGMTTLTEVVDVKKPVDQLGYKFGKDYAAVYDSTMVRLWFFNHSAKQAILETLDKTPHCNVLNDEELKRYSIDFPDNMYGEKIVLMDPGFQIAPSDMGLKALPGMHGFAPEHEDSFAAFLSSEKVDIELKCVDDYFRVMTQRMDML
ncbi:MAG: alkaline phosphatase family protein [Desulfomonilaceae bacterium]